MIETKKSKADIQKRFPSDCKDKTPDTCHLINDKNLDIKLYSIFQQRSYAVDIRDETGQIIAHETRVNKKGFPSKNQICKMLGEEKKQPDGTVKFVPKSPHTVRKHWDYLFHSSAENMYCPYIIEKEDYYVLLEKEKKYVLVPQPILDYLVTGFSADAISIYIFLLSMNNWFHYEMKKQKEGRKSAFADTELDTEEDYFIFTLKEVACNIGINVENWDSRNDLWQFDIERAETDPSYRLGTIPLAMLSLQKGELIDWDVMYNDYGHKLYILTKVNTDIKTITRPENIKKLTKQKKKNRKDSKNTIKDYGTETSMKPEDEIM